MRRHTPLALVTASLLLLGACGQDDPSVEVDPDRGDAEETDGALDGTEDAGQSDGDEPEGDTATDDGAGGAGGDDDLGAATDAAIADLAASTGADTADIEVVTAEPVTWSDGSLGCPEPDGMYTQALVPGYRIVLAQAGDEVHYHGAEGQAPQRCDDPQAPADPGV